ncbi:hypothetical protein CU044_6925 [Streptomyces sp. L-9-10]|nr:hypothetical protein CU044_6925 [Streptomyces sp. L-9-10]
MLDDLLLAAPEGVVSEDATQYLERLGRCRPRRCRTRRGNRLRTRLRTRLGTSVLTRLGTRLRSGLGNCFRARFGRGAGFRGAHPPILRGSTDIDRTDRDLPCRTCSDLHRL